MTSMQVRLSTQTEPDRMRLTQFAIHNGVTFRSGGTVVSVRCPTCGGQIDAQRATEAETLAMTLIGAMSGHLDLEHPAPVTG